MAGNPSENEIAGAVHDRIDAAWPIIAKRVRTIPAYGAAFVEAFQSVESSKDVTIVEIANALAAFMGREWQSFDAPYDVYIAGQTGALNAAEKQGMALFFGKGNCASCHAGNLFSDQSFHALALPAFGPGRTRRFDPIPRDVGRLGKSDLKADAYRFRTPMLRNVALSAPYGHNGAYPTLEGIIRHHVAVDPKWSRDMLKLPAAPWIEHVDFAIQDNPREVARLMRHRDTKPKYLTEAEISKLVAFLNALTGTTIDNPPLGIPISVPSGLPLD
jgi:cytochrome c peroxidase